MTISKAWVWVLGIIGFLLGGAAYEYHKKKEAELALDIETTKAKDAGLAQAQADVQALANQEKARIEALQKAQSIVQAPPLTPDEVKKYWNDK